MKPHKFIKWDYRHFFFVGSRGEDLDFFLFSFYFAIYSEHPRRLKRWNSFLGILKGKRSSQYMKNRFKFVAVRKMTAATLKDRSTLTLQHCFQNMVVKILIIIYSYRYYYATL